VKAQELIDAKIAKSSSVPASLLVGQNFPVLPSMVHNPALAVCVMDLGKMS
jgi:hypothetical protein